MGFSRAIKSVVDPINYNVIRKTSLRKTQFGKWYRHTQKYHNTWTKKASSKIGLFTSKNNASTYAFNTPKRINEMM